MDDFGSLWLIMGDFGSFRVLVQPIWDETVCSPALKWCIENNYLIVLIRL